MYVCKNTSVSMLESKFKFILCLLVNDVPFGAEDVERLAEAVVVDETRVETEGAHQQDDIATREDHAEHLSRAHRQTHPASHNNTALQ